MKKVIYFFVILTAYCTFYTEAVYPQWSNNPALNLGICVTTGEQALSKIALTSDGGCYISWFDQRGGNYDLYMQRLDRWGIRQWAENGMLISANPQNTWLNDYDLIADHNNNAVVVFTDIRTSYTNVYAYKLDTLGNFLWGPNGIALYATVNENYTPKVVETSDYNFVFAWWNATTPSGIALQKLSANGDKLWGTDPLFYISGTTAHYSYPNIVKSDNGGVILVHTRATGNFPAQTVHIHCQKFTSAGTQLWGAGGCEIQNLGYIAAFQEPTVTSDGSGGAFVLWYDDRDNNNISSSFIQWVENTGLFLFPLNGSEVSALSSYHHFYPEVSYLPNFGEVFVFWNEKDQSQNNSAIYGQKFSLTGTRLWGDQGIVLKDFTSNSLFGPFTFPLVSSVYVIFSEGNISGVNNDLQAFTVNRDGSMGWSPAFVTMSNPTTEKLHFDFAIDALGIVKCSWTDRRNDYADIYAQNIAPDGSLGNSYIPVELLSFTASLTGVGVLLNWSTATETNNSHFVIQRSENKDNFKDITIIRGSGTTASQSSYSYLDKEPISGINFYRLKQVDYDGSFSYSKIIEAGLTLSEFCLKQNYPNPFNPITRISYQIPKESRVNLALYDILGNQVSVLVNEDKPAGIYTVELDVSNLSEGEVLASGVYYYTIRAGSYIETKKLILMK